MPTPIRAAAFAVLAALVLPSGARAISSATDLASQAIRECEEGHISSPPYHSIQNQHADKSILRVLAHSSIYLLIAGSYTPFTLISLQGAWGWSLFGFVWGLAMFGIALQLTPLRRLSYLRLILYLTMGWAAVFAIKQLAASIPASALALLVAGGVAYTTGIIFYLWNRLPYHHAIWHVFVLSGSVLHFFAVLLSIKSSGA